MLLQADWSLVVRIQSPFSSVSDDVQLMTFLLTSSGNEVPSSGNEIQYWWRWDEISSDLHAWARDLHVFTPFKARSGDLQSISKIIYSTLTNNEVGAKHSNLHNLVKHRSRKLKSLCAIMTHQNIAAPKTLIIHKSIYHFSELKRSGSREQVRCVGMVPSCLFVSTYTLYMIQSHV